MKRLNLMPLPNEMDTEKDTIFMEDPNASRGTMPPQIDFPMEQPRMNPNMSSEELEKLLKDYSQVQFPVRTEAPPAVNNFENLLSLLNTSKAPQAPRTEGTSTIRSTPNRSIEDITPTIRPTPSVPEDVTQLVNPPTASEKPVAQTQMEVLEKLLKAREGAGNINLALRAGMMANEAIAQNRGAKVPTNEGALKALEQQAQQPLESFATQVKSKDVLEMQDPNSDISRMARERAKKIIQEMSPGMDLSRFENMSASQLEKLGLFKRPDGMDPFKMMQLELDKQRLELSRQNVLADNARSQEALMDRQKKERTVSDKQLADITNFDQALSTLSNIEGIKKQFDTGPLSGRLNSLAAAFGMDDAKFSAFRAEVGDQLAQYIKSISGAAVSDNERKELLKNLPSVNDNDKTFLSKLKMTKDRLERNQRIYLENLNKRGKDVEEFQKITSSSEQKSKETKVPVGTIVNANGKRYRVINENQDLEEIK